MSHGHMPPATDMSDEALLARILAQPETRAIAESLGMRPEDYAARVLHYARHPQAEPQLEMMSEEEARAAGMPSVAECVRFLEDTVSELERSEQAHFAGFDDDEKSSATLTGASAIKRAPRAAAPAPAPSPGGAPRRGLR